MQSENNYIDPRDKREDDQNVENQEASNTGEGVFLFNNDGTPMDTSERTYVSVDLPEDNPENTDEE